MNAFSTWQALQAAKLEASRQLHRKIYQRKKAAKNDSKK